LPNTGTDALKSTMLTCCRWAKMLWSGWAAKWRKIRKGKIAKPGVTSHSSWGSWQSSWGSWQSSWGSWQREHSDTALHQYEDRLSRQCNRPMTIWKFNHSVPQGHERSIKKQCKRQQGTATKQIKGQDAGSWGGADLVCPCVQT